jgi:hypothetical protein
LDILINDIRGFEPVTDLPLNLSGNPPMLVPDENPLLQPVVLVKLFLRLTGCQKRPPAEEGMEPDDLLCSRNARPQKALVGRAQWKINQPPSLKREQASLEG